MEDEALERLYRRKLEQSARAVADQRQAFFDALQFLAARARREGAVPNGDWEFDRWFSQAHLLLVCIRNVWRFAQALQRLRPNREELKHIHAFEHLVEPAATFRDFLEHFDDYARGEGYRQKRRHLPDPEELGSMLMGESGFPSIEYRFGGLTVNLDEASTAAVGMAQMILGTQVIRPEF
jgi:hypothetical protein